MPDVTSKSGFEEPPGSGGQCCDTLTPPHPWEHISPEDWRDWRWQMTHRLRTVEDFSRVVELSPDEIVGLSAPDCFHVDVTPYFASLMDPEDPNCPIRRQVIPTSLELVPFESEMVDSLGEEAHSPVPGLVHRYPDRVLMLITTQCASYCRFCTRSRLVGDQHQAFNTAAYERQLAYIAATPAIRDVLLSGGDPLTMPQGLLERILQRLRTIPHVEVIRIGSRVPIFLPQRVTDDLVAMLHRYHPLWMNIHINHPNEITPASSEALAKLADAGIPLGSQTVLMAGINDCPNVIKSLVHLLVRNRVRPYYLYQCDLVHGAGHFRTPVSKGLEIMESLRGHTSGFAVPTFVIDAPGGGGKVPVLPSYLLSMSDTRVAVRNYEGVIASYAQPAAYRPHDPNTCPYCRSAASDQDGAGVAGLLTGRGQTIVPEGWDVSHDRAATRQTADANGEAVTEASPEEVVYA